MDNVEYATYGKLHTTAGIFDGFKDIDPKIDPYYMEECDIPDKPNGYKLLVSEPIRF